MRGCAYGIKVHNRFAEAKGNDVEKDSGLIRSVETTAANVHDITQVADLLHGDEKVLYAAARLSRDREAGGDGG